MTDTLVQIQQKVCDYYTSKLSNFGATPQGVDWNSQESQELRFDQLLKICKRNAQFSLTDIGCGYGYLCEYMNHKYHDFSYQGFDLSPQMITQAKERYSAYQYCQFYNDFNSLKIADYAVASGIMNVKLDNSNQDWEKYIFTILNNLYSLSRQGFSFNVLTSYSDTHLMKDSLYYADPARLFDYCKKNFSRNVAILHDYDLYEFTILVRK